jgi:hypothetical protein
MLVMVGMVGMGLGFHETALKLPHSVTKINLVVSIVCEPAKLQKASYLEDENYE